MNKNEIENKDFKKISNLEIYNDDCFNILPKLKIDLDKSKSSINLVLVDLPYGQTDCKWDIKIDLNKMWIELKNICKKNCIYCFFCTTKFGYALINSKPNWFRYDLVWEKYSTVGWLSSKKLPLRKHEMIYIFSGGSKNSDLDNSNNLGLRAYAEKLRKYINISSIHGNISNKEIDKVVGNMGAHHFLFSYKSTQFSLPTEKTYNVLINKYEINTLDYFIPYKELKPMWCINHSHNITVYNPQMTKGKPYKTIGTGSSELYNGERRMVEINNKGTRYPNTILKFNHDKEHYHTTQKPVKLCEWLIKTYSNPNDLVLDFTMGSGSTGVACINTNRRFIGIEKDKDIFNIAKSRLINKSD